MMRKQHKSTSIMRVNQGGADLNVVRSKESHSMLPDVAQLPNSNLSMQQVDEGVRMQGSAVAVTDQQMLEPLFGGPDRQGMTHAAKFMNGTNTNHKSGGNLAQSNIHEMVA